jgi:putative spermidine/putrescine transport system ATP-binding protein
MVAGFLSPDRGSIVLNGRDLKRVSAADRGIGVVFQHYALFPHMTVEENIAYGLRRRHWPKKRIAERVAEMLELIGLEALGGRRPSQLSGGQQQRVALARALAFEPTVLLMDEPLGALDREIRQQMQEEVRRIHRELKPSVLYVTHNKDEAFALSDRIGIMRDARLAALGSASELYRAPATTFVASFFAGRQLLDVDVVSVDERAGTVRVRLAGAEALIRLGAHVPNRKPMKLAVAPQSVRPLQGDGAGMVIAGRIHDIVYMGHLTHIHCVIDAGGQRIVAELRSEEADKWVVGSDVQLEVDRDDVFLVPLEHEQA